MVGQEHFYLETHTCLVIPGEDGEMEVVSSTQVANDVQVSHGSNVDTSRICS